MKKILGILASPYPIIIAAALLRLLPHPANFAPIAAIALFSGATLSKRYAVILPMTAMVVSDFFLGFHSTMVWVYGSFIISSLLGMLIKNRVNMFNVIYGSVASSVLFFIITNFGVWFSTTMYPKSIDGLVLSYVMALPFFQNTLFGDLFYTGVFFTSWYLLQLYMSRFNYSEVK